jgi:penicillin-binding protein 1A
VYGQGATMALPIWALYMKQNYSDTSLNISQEDFEEPEEMSIRINCALDLNNEEDKARMDDDLDDFGF